MLAISPQFCSLGWMLEDPMLNIHEQENHRVNYFSRETSDQSIHDLHSPNSSRSLPQNGESATSSKDGFINGDCDNMDKKLNHNASERVRRKKINTLYTDLRSLLPSQDQSRKLSIPATVSRVLKYIPELQKEVERLIQKKKRLISKVEEYSLSKIKNQKITRKVQDSNSAVSATRISDGEIIIQSSMPKSEKGSFSEVIVRLEEEGFLMMSSSCFQSFEGRLFYNLHLQAQEGQVIDVEMLKEKVWPPI